MTGNKGAKKFSRVLVYLFFLVFLLEMTARGYFSLVQKMPFSASPDDLALRWYPMLDEVKAYSYDKNYFNILLLGGSVLVPGCGYIPQYLNVSAEKYAGKPVRIVNLSQMGHSSLDSYYKYSETMGKKFDLVIFYHAINDSRLNNIPPELFKDDYSHCFWYDEVNRYFANPVFRKTFLLAPYFIMSLALEVKKDFFYKDKYISQRFIPMKWLKYGGDIKTKKSFERNVRKVVEISRKKGEPILLMSFAYYLDPERDKGFDPDNISEEGRPRATPKWNPDLWGLSKNIAAAIDAHNEIIERVASETGCFYLDQKRYFTSGRYFRDECHFTEEGSAAFALRIAYLIGDNKEKIAQWGKD